MKGDVKDSYGADRVAVHEHNPHMVSITIRGVPARERVSDITFLLTTDQAEELALLLNFPPDRGKEG